MPPPEFAAKLRMTRMPGQVRSKTDSAPRFSNHMFHDAFSVTVHAIAAQKILKDPRVVEQARKILERWISRQIPVPKPFLEWRKILAARHKRSQQWPRLSPKSRPGCEAHRLWFRVVAKRAGRDLCSFW